MGRRVLSVAGYDAEAIKRIIREDEAYLIGVKLYGVYLVASGMSSRDVEVLYGVSFKQVTNWVHRFEKDGVEGLRERKGRGRKSRLTAAQMFRLKKVLLNSPLSVGFEAKAWSGPLVGDWVLKTFQVVYKRAQIYKIIGELGLRYEKGKGFVGV